MKIVISEIPEEGIELDLACTFESDEFKLLAPVKALVRFDKFEDEVMARGVISGDVEMTCARCLKQYTQKISSQVNVVYQPALDISRHEQHELKNEELDTVFYTEDKMETDDLLKDQLMLNLPMKPLCSSECRGFCAVCGADMNVSACGCGGKETDPRFEVLKNLQIKKEQ